MLTPKLDRLYSLDIDFCLIFFDNACSSQVRLLLIRRNISKGCKRKIVKSVYTVAKKTADLIEEDCIQATSWKLFSVAFSNMLYCPLMSF